MRVEDHSVKHVVADILSQIAYKGKAEGWSTADPEMTIWNLVVKELAKYNVYYVDDMLGIWERTERV